MGDRSADSSVTRCIGQKPLGSFGSFLCADNVLAHASRNGRRFVSAFMATAFAPDDAETAKAQWRRVADQLQRKLKLTRFRGHPNICVQGAHDGEDETTLHT
jgi:hypothetical protein